MRLTRKTSIVAVSLSLALFAAACGNDDDTPTDTTGAAESSAVTEETTVDSAAPDTTPADTVAPDTAASTDTGASADTGAATETTAGGTAAATGSSDLKAAACPDPLVIQTDWYAEVDHSELYQLAADGGVVNKEKLTYTAPLIDPRNGQDTGVKIEIRQGGPATQFQQPWQLMQTDPSIFGGYVNTDDAILQAKDNPTVAVVAPRERNPQIIMWDPVTYPNVKTIADLGKEKVKVRYFANAGYMEFLLGTGVLTQDQVDSSYDGTSAAFVADGGKSAQQGFVTAEPYAYEFVHEGWKKKIAYEVIADAGYDGYAEAIAVTPKTLAEKKDCLRALVPMIQAAQVNFIKDPAANEARIVKIVAEQAASWVYTAEQAAAATKLSTDNGIISNGPDAIHGNMTDEKVQALIAILAPIAQKNNAPLKEGLTPADIHTNEFIDPSIGLPS